MTTIAAQKKYSIPFKVAPVEKKTIVGNELLGIGVLEIPTYGQLLTAEQVFIDSAELWDRDVIDRETSKLSKSIYDREKAKNSKLSLPQTDLMVRRIVYSNYPSLSVEDLTLIGDYAIEVKEFAMDAKNTSIQALAQSIYDREKAKYPDLSRSKGEYDAALQRMIEVHKISVEADTEALYEYTDEILAFAKKLGDESDRRYYTYALMVFKFRLPDFEEITLAELRDLVGRPLLARLAFFGYRESQGQEYDEVEDFGTGEKPKPEPIEERSEADILKP
jgi:hypothetical protein